MTQSPLLEDLRHHAAPVWLWDPARARVVWANAQGITAFDCETLFDLIDKPFAAQEPGVAAIMQASARVSPGAPEQAALAFPASGLATPLDCTLHHYPLADGRPGLLAVAKLPQPAAEAPAPTLAGDWHKLLAAMPQGAALCAGDGALLACNAVLKEFFGGETPSTLTALLAHESRAAAALERLQGQAMASSIERIDTASGLREARLTLSRLPEDEDGRLLLLLEDVTERRRLERRLSELADGAPPPAPPPAAPAITTADQAFAEIGRQLTHSLQTAPAAKPEAAVPPPPAKVSAAPATPVIPEAIRQTLEQAASGIAICQHGQPVYVTQKALDVLGFTTREDALASTGLWQALAAVGPGVTQTLTLDSGRSVTVSAMPMPWQNGRALQYAFRAPAPASEPKTEKPSPPIEAAAPKAEPPPPPPPEPQADVTTTPAAPVALSAPDALQAELKAILDVASDGIITLNGEGEILTFSGGAEAIFGASSGECVGRPLSDLLAPDSRKTWRDYLKSLSSPGLGAVFNDGREMTALHRNGGALPLFVSLSRLHMPAGKARFCAVVRDITPWKKTERELTEAKDKAEQSSRRKSEFIAHVSHELRTPLNAILGFSDVMRQEKLGPFGNSKYLAYANDIHASGTHLLSIVNDLLDLAKVEAGKLELNFTAISLPDVADYVLRLTRDEAAQASVVVRKAFPANLPRVVGDLKSLRQVLLNLVSNAIKFTNAGGEVLLSAHVEGNGALALRVKDSGVGMTDEQVEAALRPFGRVEDAARPRQGTGLGLPLTKSLVEANRAQLMLRSEPGRGTVAEIIFPGPRVLAE